MLLLVKSKSLWDIKSDAMWLPIISLTSPSATPDLRLLRVFMYFFKLQPTGPLPSHT